MSMDAQNYVVIVLKSVSDSCFIPDPSGDSYSSRASSSWKGSTTPRCIQKRWCREM